MKSSRLMVSPVGVCVTFIAAGLVLAPTVGLAAEAASAGPVFQKPSRTTAKTPSAGGNVKFRRAATANSSRPAPAPAAPAVATAASANDATTLPLENSLRPPVAASAAPSASDSASTEAAQAAFRTPARPIATAPRPAAERPAVRTAQAPSFATPGQDLSGLGATSKQRAIAAASIEPWAGEPTVGASVQQAGYCDCGLASCPICGPSCGTMVEPGCGTVEPDCGAEPACGVVEPGCGLEAGCGVAEPDCGAVGCGNCVGNPGPDYWCFPVCFPRFKDLRFWGGVHGFKGPRDSPQFGGAGDGNFGFQEGVNIGGRAPLVSLLFPQLSYQLGYQAVQSQLSGLSLDSSSTASNTSDRSQQFVTAGLFRRVNAGVQFGLVWDMLRDDFQSEEDFHQLRYEVSLKSRSGREFGFWGASHTNDKTVAGINYQAVDQYCGFVRLHFRDGGYIRFWGGGTNDNEGLFGSDFVAPLNDRWSVQTGFNYLITDLANGPDGAREESWNVGLNLVWHYGLTAKNGQSNPHAPLFPTADNGWLFIDRTP